MFVDNTKKIIVLSVPGTDSYFAEMFFRQQFQQKSISVQWVFLRSVTESEKNDIPIGNLNVDKLPQNMVPQSPSDRVLRRSGILLPKISDIIELNILNAPWYEYQIYGMCTNPIDRIIIQQEELIYIGAYMSLMRCIEENKEVRDYIPNREALIPESIKTRTLNSLMNNYVVNLNGLKFDPNDSKFPDYMKQQVLWLKHQDNLINHIFKYDNYVDFVSAISAIYEVDASLYDDIQRISSRKSNLTANDLSVELCNAILEQYPDDKILYDSL
jgi:hypothetical protein